MGVRIVRGIVCKCKDCVHVWLVRVFVLYMGSIGVSVKACDGLRMLYLCI